MWDYLAAPVLAGVALLVAAGLPKVLDPMPLVRAIRSAGLPSGRGLVRILAAGEVAIGVAFVLAPGRLTAGLVAFSYAGFTGFVLLVRRRGGVLGSCGCFGKVDTPPTVSHLVLTGALAGAAALVALDPPISPWSVPLLDLGLLAGVSLLLAFLAWLVMAVLPTVSATAVRATAVRATAVQTPGRG